jgi:hypothetical protein
LHSIEPYYSWRAYYTAEEDARSPFYGTIYSEFEFTNSIYNFAIHPQWDDIGSQTLFLKLLFCDYDEGYAIIELIGEWNDLLYSDIIKLKRDFCDLLLNEGINKFILIGENVLNFHADSDDYYEEWFEDIEDGWITLLNFRDHVIEEFSEYNIDHYFLMGGKLQDMAWRTYKPEQLYLLVDSLVNKRIG